MVVYKALSCLQINVVIYPALHLLEQLPTDKSRNAQICMHAYVHVHTHTRAHTQCTNTALH